MNIFKQEDIKKTLERSRDSAYRLEGPRVPIQPVMSYRFAKGSDTGPAPQPRPMYNPWPESRHGNPKVEQDGADFLLTGGTKKVRYDTQDKP
jgi:hypothetical protein